MEYVISIEEQLWCFAGGGAVRKTNCGQFDKTPFQWSNPNRLRGRTGEPPRCNDERRAMGTLVGALGKVVVSAAIVVLAAGVLLAFVTMGPPRQAPVALAPTPTPQAPGPEVAPTPTPPTSPAPAPKTAPPYPTPKPRPEDAPILGGAIGEPFPTTSYSDLVREKDIIAIGMVKEVGPARWNTADGKRPPVYHNLPYNEQRRYVIYRPIVVQVERYIKPEAPGAQVITFGQAGGQVGQDSFVYSGDPQTPFVGGERVLVFLKRGSLNALPGYAPEANPSFFNAGGKHTVGADGRARYREIDLPLEEVVRGVEEALRQQ